MPAVRAQQREGMGTQHPRTKCAQPLSPNPTYPFSMLAGEAAALGMDLQRPFDLNRTTPTSGHWRWVGLPQARLSCAWPRAKHGHTTPVHQHAAVTIAWLRAKYTHSRLLVFMPLACLPLLLCVVAWLPGGRQC